MAGCSDSRLVGIARLAAASELLEAKRQVQYFELPSRSFITRCESKRVPFRWTVNPYRGCEFGCRYCYARYTHEFMELRDGMDFEKKIYAKLWSAEAFRRDLAKVPREESIAIGTATDPYQPAERRYGVMRKMLEVLAGGRGYRIWITTKSDLVARDADLLAAISRHNQITVHLTVTTTDAALARLLEPYAPRPDRRLAAVKTLRGAGVAASVFSSPILPLLNDSEESLDAVAAAAKEAGAISWGGNVLFLKDCARAVFFPFLEQHFPHLLQRYRERFEASAYLRGSYPEKIEQRIARIREKHGLGRRTEQYRPEDWYEDEQLSLFTRFTA
ncbi:MAG: radical SAM protein [Bryobacteraceae bacterium]|nr:radical SAM protein [Bryobacteraceae bacterium]